MPAKLLGAVPKGWLWPGMWCALHSGQVNVVDWLEYLAGSREDRHSPYLQTHGAFHFLLDYVPRWQWMTKPGGLMDIAVSTNRQRRGSLWRLCQELADVVLENGGRSYYAKDAVLLESSFARVHGEQAVAKFRALKQKWHPDRPLQTDLSRRLGV